MVAAAILSHNCNIGTRGPDALNEQLDFTEYKSAEQGGSYQFHWLSANSIASVKAVRQMIAIVRSGAELKQMLNLVGDVWDKVSAGVISKSTNTADISAHKSFTLDHLLTMGAKVVYGKDGRDIRT